MELRYPELERNLPPSMKMKVAYDSTKFIQSSIDEVTRTLGRSRGDCRHRHLPVPRHGARGGDSRCHNSVVADRRRALMLILGFWFNLLTLLAMVLAIGLVVDDAIVVVENIHRHLEEG